MMLKTSCTYLFQSLTGIGSSGPRAMFSKYSIYMLATTGEQGKPIAAPCSCLKNLSWKVKTQFSKAPRLFTEHIEDPEAKHKYGCSFRRNTIGLEKDEVMQLLKLVLENCVFTFQDKFFKQLHGAAMGSPCSPVVANIYMEYFENIALGPELPIPVKDWKRYVHDVFSIIPKGNWDKILQYLNSIDPT